MFNFVIMLIVFLRILPGYSSKLYIPVNDSDISILKIEPVLQMLRMLLFGNMSGAGRIASMVSVDHPASNILNSFSSTF